MRALRNLLFLLVLLPAPAVAIDAGEPIAPVAFEDQHETKHTLDESTQLVLFTRDMDAGAFVREVLAGDGNAKLDAAAELARVRTNRLPPDAGFRQRPG